MKKAIFLALLGATTFGASAQAQVTYDMAKVTCADYSAMDPVTAQGFSAWMSGWFNQQRNDTSINVEGYRQNVANVRSWCASNPQADIMASLQAAVANAKPGQGGPTDIQAAQITCGEFLNAAADDQALVATWMGGWFMSTKNLTQVDLRYVRRNSEKIGAYCKTHKKENLMAAIGKNWK